MISNLRKTSQLLISSVKRLRKINMTEPPVVVILGTTASGKSKLAIELAKFFNGEVISADSMQIYRGLDILTNKASDEEMQNIPHHMMSIVEPTEKYDVVNFRNEALRKIDNILESGKIPIIVGGTNYYIESLLFKTLVDKPASTSSVAPCSSSYNDLNTIKNNVLLQQFDAACGNVVEDCVEQWSNEELHNALKLVDVERASRLHPNDRRKVFRSLQIRFQTGRKHSDIILDQLAIKDPAEISNKALGGQLRYKNSLCLWIQVEPSILEHRINARVDEMVHRGLRAELNEFVDSLRKDGRNIDYTKGILQSIGYKEFHPYLQLQPGERDSDLGDQLFEKGMERLKVVTRQYAKKQIKWINQRYLSARGRNVPAIYGLNGNKTDSLNWTRNVTEKSIDIMNAILKQDWSNNILLTTKLKVVQDDTNDDLVKRVCDVCDNRIFIGKKQWTAHLKSSKHYRMKRKLQDQCTSGNLSNPKITTEKNEQDGPSFKILKSSSITKLL